MIVVVDWYLNKALTNFRNAVNMAYPRRDRASDGTIGDPDHAARSSDHNPDPDGSVDAWDMDVEVNGKGKPYTADVEELKRVFQAHESSSYWIHNDQIARRADGWRRRPYGEFNDDPGRNKHTQHVHWNTRSSHENSTKPWPIQEDDMTPEEHNWLRDIRYTLTAIPNPNGTDTRVPHHFAMAALDAQLDAVLAGQAVLTPAELAQIKQAAMEGAAQAMSVVDWANLIPDEIAQEVANLLAARLQA